MKVKYDVNIIVVVSIKALGNVFEAFDLTSKLFKKNYYNDMAAFDAATYDICSMDYTQVWKIIISLSYYC